MCCLSEPVLSETVDCFPVKANYLKIEWAHFSLQITNSIVYRYHIFIMYSPVHEHLGYFQILAIINVYLCGRGKFEYS